MCHIDIVDMLIRYHGTLLSLYHLAEESGITAQEVPKYYPGLTIHGEKRKEWARQDRYTSAVDKSETASPLLDAILEGNLDIVEIFSSETPQRKYEEFCTESTKISVFVLYL